MKRVLWMCMASLLAGCNSGPNNSLSDNEKESAIKLKILPDEVHLGKFHVECINCEPANQARVDRGDWIEWTHEFESEDPLVVEFSKASDSGADLARAAALFGVENPSFILTFVVRRGVWTWTRVGDEAAEGKHAFGVVGKSYNDPPPGIIVCPPGSTNPACR